MKEMSVIADRVTFCGDKDNPGQSNYRAVQQAPQRLLLNEMQKEVHFRPDFLQNSSDTGTEMHFSELVHAF